MDVHSPGILYKTVLLFETPEMQLVTKVGRFSIACVMICASVHSKWYGKSSVFLAEGINLNFQNRGQI